VGQGCFRIVGPPAA